MSSSEIVSKVWNYAHVLRDDGIGYGDYVEQITYLIFLKVADERDRPKFHHIKQPVLVRTLTSMHSRSPSPRPSPS